MLLHIAPKCMFRVGRCCRPSSQSAYARDLFENRIQTVITLLEDLATYSAALARGKGPSQTLTHPESTDISAGIKKTSNGCADIGKVIDVISEMEKEYCLLVHQLELAHFRRIKYYEQYPKMVYNFRRGFAKKVNKCRCETLNKLKGAFQQTKEIHQLLSERKRHLMHLRGDNSRIQFKGLVEAVAKETAAITNQVLTYYNRRSENKNAIINAIESVRATEERIVNIEINNALEIEDWDDENYGLQWKGYEKDIAHAAERNDSLMHSEAINFLHAEEKILNDNIAETFLEIEYLRSEYEHSLETLKTQHEISATAHETLTSRLDDEELTFTQDDIEKWSAQIYQLGFPTSERKATTDMELEQEEMAEFARERDDKITGDIRNLFQSPVAGTDDAEARLSAGQNSEWDHLVDSLQTDAELEDKMKTTVEEEERLHKEMQKKKRSSTAKSKKVERFKKLAGQLQDENRAIQQNCDMVHNRISDCVDEQQTVTEETANQVDQMITVTLEENEHFKELQEQFSVIEAALSEFTKTTTVETEDLRDEAANNRDEEVLITEFIEADVNRAKLMAAEIEHGKNVRVEQNAIRAEIAAECEELEHQREITDAHFADLSHTFDDEEETFDNVYQYISTKLSQIAIICKETNSAVKQAQITLTQWKEYTADAKALVEEARNNFQTVSQKAATFGKYFEEDTEDFRKSVLAYKTISRICRDYSDYATSQTEPALEAVEELSEAIDKVIRERPQVQAEILLKKEICRKHIERMINSGPAGEHAYKECMSFLREAHVILKDTRTALATTDQYSELTTTQCQKLYDIADHFACYLLRKQPTIDLDTLPHLDYDRGDTTMHSTGYKTQLRSKIKKH